MAKLFVFRHAQTTDNEANIFTGTKRDPDLTMSGIEEAREIRDKLRQEKVTKAYCTPNKRCKHTLEIVLEHHLGVEMIADPRIKEKDYGELTGKNKQDMERLHPKEYPKWHRSYDIPPPGGESIKMIENRINEFIKELINNVWQNDVILICGNGNSLRPIRKHFEGMSNEEMATYENTRGKIYSYDI